MMNSKVKNVLLWVGLLPSCFLAGILAYVAAKIMWEMSGWGTGTILDVWYIEIGASFGSGVAYGYVAYKMPPAYNKTASIILTMVLTLLIGANFFVVNAVTLQYYSNLGLTFILIGAIGACLATVNGWWND